MKFVELFGGGGRFVTLMTVILHFLNPLFSLTAYLNWVRAQQSTIGDALVVAYLVVMVISILSYIFVSSVFYMWAWRFPEPEEIAKRRRIYGIAINLIFCDIPIFAVGTKIVWKVHFVDGVQGFSYCLSCLSLAYSALRVWSFAMVVVIKARMPKVEMQRYFDVPECSSNSNGGRRPQWAVATEVADMEPVMNHNEAQSIELMSRYVRGAYPNSPSVSRPAPETSSNIRWVD